MTHITRDDRGAVWLLFGMGRQEAMPLARMILADQDTADLHIWRRDALRLVEAITDEVDGRTGEDHFPRHGMSDEGEDT